MLPFPGRDLPKVTTGSSLLNNNLLSDGKRYKTSFSWYVGKIIDKKAQANKCPSLLQFPGKDLPKVTTDSSLLNNNLLSNGKRYKTSFSWYVGKIIDKKAQANKCPSLLQFPGKDLPKVTTDSSLLNNNLLSNGKRYKTSFSWYVGKIIDKKAQANKCPSLLQFPGKDLPKVTTDSSLLNNNLLSNGKRYKTSFSWYVGKIIDKKAEANKCPSLLPFPGKDLPKVTTDRSLLNNNSLSNGKRYKIIISFSWYVGKIIDKKAQANKCPSLLQFPGKDLPKVRTGSSLLNNNLLSNGKRYKTSFSWYVRKIIDKKAQANKCPSLLQFPGKDLPKVTTDSSLLNNNLLSNGKRYKTSFSWYVGKIIDKKAQANKCPSLLPFPGKDLPKVTTDRSLLNNNSLSNGKRYKIIISFSWYVGKIIDKKAQANKCPSLLQFPGKDLPKVRTGSSLLNNNLLSYGKRYKTSFSWYVGKIIDKKAQANKCPSLLPFPGKDLPKVTTDRSLLNNNSLSNGKRYKIIISFSWYVGKIIDKKAQANKCPSLLQFPGKDLPKVTTDSSLLNNNLLSNGKRYKTSFSWYVGKIIDKKAQANKCPSLLQFPSKDLPKVRTGSSLLNNNSLSNGKRYKISFS